MYLNFRMLTAEVGSDPSSNIRVDTGPDSMRGDYILGCADSRVRERRNISRRRKGSRIRAVYMGNLKGLLGIRRIDTLPNARVSVLCEVDKKVL